MGARVREAGVGEVNICLSFRGMIIIIHCSESLSIIQTQGQQSVGKMTWLSDERGASGPCSANGMQEALGLISHK